MRPQLQLAAPVVDDERVEEPQRVHAEQQGGFLRQPPVLEDAHLAVGDARTANLG